MRVLHVQRLRGMGGSERHLLTLLPALRERGVDVRFAGLDVPGGDWEPIYAQLAAAGVPAEHVRSPRDLWPPTAAALARLVRTLRPDVLHTHLVHADAYGALAAALARVPVVSTKHNDDPFRAGAFRHVERLLTRRAARVICITESVARFNREVVGLPPKKLVVVRYGLDAEPPAWGEPSPQLDVPEGARVLLAVGRLVEQKGIDVAIRTLARLGDEVVLVVLGEGPERARLEGLARGLGVGDRVVLVGAVGDVAAWMRRAELLVHPARWEGFGLVLLEAMHAGLPVVASRVGAIPEVVVDGETGILVEPDDPEALAVAIRSLLDDPERAGGLGARGRERARTEFSVAAMADATIRVYEDALA